MKYSKILAALLLAFVVAFAAFACTDPQTDQPVTNDPGGNMDPVTPVQPYDPPSDDYVEEDTAGAFVFEKLNTKECRLLERTGKFTGKLVIPSTWTTGGVTYTVTEIAANALHHARSVTEIVVPDTVTVIGQGAFYGCTSLTSIQLPHVGQKQAADSASAAKLTTAYLGYIFGARSFAENDAYVPQSLQTVVLTSACQRIESHAFDGCSGVSHVQMPDGLTYIGQYAFANCALQTVTVPNSVQEIGEGAFKACPLQSMTLPFVGADATGTSGHLGYLFGTTDYTRNERFVPATLTTVDLSTSTCTVIGQGAFYSCSHISDIRLPSTILSVGSSAFTGTPYYDKQADGPVYVGQVLYTYKGALMDPHIVVRAGTVAIADHALDGLGITSITFEDMESISRIGYAALRGAKLTQITLPFIGESAAGDTSNTHLGYIFGDALAENGTSVPATLTTVTIDDRCTAIGASAFVGCTKLQTVVIGSGVTSIAQGAFYQAPSIATITLKEGNTAFYSHTDGLLYNAAKNELVAVPMAVTGSLKLLNVTTLHDAIFEGCTGITGLSLPDTLTVIGARAFSGCTSLAQINFPAALTTVGRDALKNTAWYTAQPDGMLYLEGSTILYAYKGDAPSSLTVKDGTTFITAGAFAFSGDAAKDQLLTISIPTSVKQIGEGILSGRSKVTAVVIPFIGASAEDTTIGLVGYLFGANTVIEARRAGVIPTTLAQVQLLSTCYRIPSNAFAGCTNVSSVQYDEDTIRLVAGGALDETAWRKTLTAPGVIYVGHVVYGYNAGGGTDIVVRDGTVGIASYAFDGADITSIWLPDSITAIGEYAFTECTSLTSIAMSQGLTDMGRYAFNSCSALTFIYVPNGVKSVAEGAFSGCSSLQTILLQEGVERFGADALDGCTAFAFLQTTKSEKASAELNKVLTNSDESITVFLENHDISMSKNTKYTKPARPETEEA